MSISNKEFAKILDVRIHGKNMTDTIEESYASSYLTKTASVCQELLCYLVNDGIVTAKRLGT